MSLALLAFGFGLPEVVIILVVALIIFGPSKLPQLGSGIGKMLRGFKKEMKELEREEGSGSESKAIDDEAASEIDVTPKTEQKAG